MSKFKVTLEDGSRFVITTEQSDADIQQVSTQPNTAFLPREGEVNKLISQRPDSVASLKEELKSPFEGGVIRKGLKGGAIGLKAAAIPFQRLESGVSGFGLGLQKGSFGEGFKNLKLGITGQRQQELGDIIRTTGFGGEANEAIATATGFTAALVTPFKALKDGLKSLSSIKKAGDKGMIVAGRKLINASDDAVKTIGRKLDDVYKPVNSTKVNADKAIDDIADLPEPIIKSIERELGTSIDDFMSDFDVSKARILKRKLGELRPSAFGKAEKGAIELVTDKQINRAYASVKNSIQESLNAQGFNKQADALLRADDAFVETLNSSNLIRKTVVDPTLRKPTRGGKAALGLNRQGDLSTREALNVLRQAGDTAKSNINKAIFELEKFNRNKKIAGFTGGLLRAGVLGGVAGASGGKIIEATSK